MQNRRSAPRLRTHFDSDHRKRSWRTIEPARRNIKDNISQARTKPLTEDPHGLDRDQGRKNAGKKGMQGAAVVGVISVPTALMIGVSRATLIMRMLMMYVRSHGIREGLRARQWRGHDARELGSYEQRNEDADKATYRPKPPHDHRRIVLATSTTPNVGSESLRCQSAGRNPAEIQLPQSADASLTLPRTAIPATIIAAAEWGTAMPFDRFGSGGTPARSRYV
jgi:hypothetical protein